jgi:rod shape-determining protein MreD
MNVFVLSVFSYALLSLESPLLYEFGLSLHSPDLGIALLLAAAPRLSAMRVVVFGFIVGLLLDSFVPLSPLGLHTERMVILAYAVRTFLSSVPVRGVVPLFLVGIGFSLISDFFLFVLLAIFDPSFVDYQLIFVRMIPHAVVTGASVPVVAWMMSPIWRRIRAQKGSIFYS